MPTKVGFFESSHMRKLSRSRSSGARYWFNLGKTCVDTPSNPEPAVVPGCGDDPAVGRYSEPVDPRVETCDLCHKPVPLRKAIFTGVQILCPKCNG